MTEKLLKKTLILISLFFLLDFSIGFMLKIFGKADQRFESTMTEFYGLQQNIDLIFMGSSHSSRHFDPTLFDEAFHLNSFNLGSAGQNYTTSYYLLQEVLRFKHRPRMILCDISFRALGGEDVDFHSASQIFYNMKFSHNKINLFLHSFKFPSSLRLFSNTFRYRRQFKTIWFGEEKDQGLNLKYMGKGFVTSERKATAQELRRNEYRNTPFDFNENRVRYLKKTLELALESHAYVLAITSPLPPSVFKDIQNYGIIHEKIKNICDAYHIEFIDLNLINDDLHLFGDSAFMDTHHLNHAGVSLLNDYLIRHLKSGMNVFPGTNSLSRK